MAFTIDKTTGATCLPAVGMDKHFVLHNYVDFTVAANQIGNGEVAAIFDIPAHVLVPEVFLYIVVTDAHIDAWNLGSYLATGAGEIDEDGFLNDADLHLTTGWVRVPAAVAYASPVASAGYIAASAWVVDFLHNTAATLNDAKVHFYAKCINLSDMVTSL